MSFDRREFEKLLFELEVLQEGEDSKSIATRDEVLNRIRRELSHSPEARKCFARWQILRHTLAQDLSFQTAVGETVAPSRGEFDEVVPTYGASNQAMSNQTVSEASRVSRHEERRSAAGSASAQWTSNDSKSPGALRWARLLAIASAITAVMLGARVLYLESVGPTVSSDRDGSRLSQRTITGPREQGRTSSGTELTSAVDIKEGEQTFSGLAIVTALVDAELGEESQVVREGGALGKGLFSLARGNAQIEFFGGASVVLEGPASIDVLDIDQVRCLSGKLRAQVPPAARGFEVLTPDNRIVDLGTEFGVNVDGKDTVLQVFDGEVEWHSSQESTESPERLIAGQAVTWNADSRSQIASAANPSGFLGLSDLQGEVQADEQERLDRWRQFSARWKADSRLITYYAMSDADVAHRKLRNSQSDSELDGAIVGAKVVSGRWDDKAALEFKHPGDRVKVNIPGEFSSLSFLCWVRIDSLDRWYNSLFLTDSYERGEPHWQILDSGQLFFSVRVSRKQGGPEHHVALSPVFWKPSMSGQWLHLATTYDVENQQTCHYLDGELLSRERIPAEKVVTPTRIGLASIGNWSSPTKPDEIFAIRNLNGRMDELMIFNEALSSEEIGEIYSNGKP